MTVPPHLDTLQRIVLGGDKENHLPLSHWKFPPDDTTHSEALGTLPVSVSSGHSGTILRAVADSRETRGGSCAGVVGEVNELYDGIVDTAISVQGRVSLTDNKVKNRENKNAEGTHF